MKYILLFPLSEIESAKDMWSLYKEIKGTQFSILDLQGDDQKVLKQIADEIFSITGIEMTVANVDQQ